MVPTYDQIMLPLLRIIENGKNYSNKECEEKLGKHFKLTEIELNEKVSTKDSKRKFYDRLNWAKTYLKKAEAIETTDKRGEFKITKRGKEILNEKIDKLDKNYLKKYPSFLKFLKIQNLEENKKNKIEDNIDTPVENLEKTYFLLNQILKEDILEKLKNVNPYKFEEIVIELIVKMGYGGSEEEISTKLTSKGSDGGIDGIINEDRLGLDKIYLQAKRWGDKNVGRPEIQAFVGALSGLGALNKGIFITTSSFSKDALKFSEEIKNHKIILINGVKLVDYMLELNIGVSIEQTYEVKKIDIDYFSED